MGVKFTTVARPLEINVLVLVSSPVIAGIAGNRAVRSKGAAVARRTGGAERLAEQAVVPQCASFHLVGRRRTSSIKYETKNTQTRITQTTKATTPKTADPRHNRPLNVGKEKPARGKGKRGGKARAGKMILRDDRSTQQRPNARVWSYQCRAWVFGFENAWGPGATPSALVYA